MREKICVCSVQVPFIRGGAEYLADSLVEGLQRRSYVVDQIRLPLQTRSLEEILRSCLAWRLVDLQEADQVIATKFPSYLIPHRNKTIWLVHQLRGAYNLYGTVYSGFGDDEKANRLREYIVELDHVAFSEAKAIFTISKTVSARLKKFNGFDSVPLYPPLNDAERFHFTALENFVLSVSRIEADKRVELLIEAMTLVPKQYKAVIVGDGSQRKKCEELASTLGLKDRVCFTGWISRDQIIDYYSRAGAVFYGPIDEDYGYATLEAFYSRKPVITTSDSGGILEFVDGSAGWIVEPQSQPIAESIEEALATKDDTKIRGETGFSKVSHLSWDYVQDALTGRR